MKLLSRIGPNFMGIGRLKTFGLKVAYTATGAITDIDPETVTFANDIFKVPKSVTEFSFEDDGVDYTAYYDLILKQWIIFEGTYPVIFDETFNATFR